ncbi:MAG: hypothetical protein ACTSRP_03490 [Candidatus Helarchaeota archaeon]
MTELIVKNHQIPYIDFYFPYPPLVSILFFIVGIIDPSVITFKIVFILVNIFNAYLLYYLGKLVKTKEFGISISIIFLLLPLNIIEIGWSGHFDSVMIFFLLLCVIFYLKKHIFLHIFTFYCVILLKFYPIILLPIFLYFAGNRKNKIMYFLKCVTPILVGAIVFSIISYDTFTSILLYQISRGPTNNLFYYIYHIFDYKVLYAIEGIITLFLLIALFKPLNLIKSKGFFQVYIIFSISITILGVFQVVFNHIITLSSLTTAGYTLWYKPTELYTLYGSLIIFNGIILSIISYLNYKKLELNIIKSNEKLLTNIFCLFLIFYLWMGIWLGWYFLWAIPFIFFLPKIYRNKRYIKLRVKMHHLFILLFLFLLISQTYYEINFNSLGISEDQYWKFDKDNTDHLINVSGYVGSSGDYGFNFTDIGDIWLKPSYPPNKSEYVSISLKVNELVKQTSYIVFKVRSDTPEHRYAFYLEISYRNETHNINKTEYLFNRSNIHCYIYSIFRLELINIYYLNNITISIKNLFLMENTTLHFYIEYIYLTTGQRNYLDLPPSPIGIYLIPIIFIGGFVVLIRFVYFGKITEKNLDNKES